jgi:hypothetical protein
VYSLPLTTWLQVPLVRIYLLDKGDASKTSGFSRNYLTDMNSVEAMEFLRDSLFKTATITRISFGG